MNFFEKSSRPSRPDLGSKQVAIIEPGTVNYLLQFGW